MDLRVLNYFLIVAKEGNITKSAKLLHITQPTLSRQIQKLEDELGVKLFKRSKYNVYLTDKGRLFFRRAQEIISLSEKAKSEINQPDEIITGEIVIGCGELNSMSELSEMMIAFREKYPLVIFELKSGNNIDIKNWLEHGILDIGLMIEPIDIGKQDYRRMKTKEYWGVLVRKDSEFAKRKSIKPEDLVDVPLITIGDSMMIHNKVINWFGNYAKDMKPIVHYNLLNNAATMLQQKAGVSICLRPNCNYENLCFIPFEPELMLSSALVWKNQENFTTATTAFIQFIKKYK